MQFLYQYGKRLFIPTSFVRLIVFAVQLQVHLLFIYSFLSFSRKFIFWSIIHACYSLASNLLFDHLCISFGRKYNFCSVICSRNSAAGTSFVQLLIPVIQLQVNLLFEYSFLPHLLFGHSFLLFSCKYIFFPLFIPPFQLHLLFGYLFLLFSGKNMFNLFCHLFMPFCGITSFVRLFIPVMLLQVYLLFDFHSCTFVCYSFLLFSCKLIFCSIFLFCHSVSKYNFFFDYPFLSFSWNTSFPAVQLQVHLFFSYLSLPFSCN